ncbi:hypothetical protein [Clostridium sp. YIM B02506]|uniref:hypothetical protein n=1 Tax=Clostridium sp. YIM B02506 TaxID=2910680 RepID=UPI001EEDC34E|nr:hypothetical protein [Clostridium sp. YIM B02506]
MNIALIYGFLAIITFAHAFMCYKKKTLIRPLSKRPLLVVNNSFYKLQFNYGSIATIIFILISLVNTIISNKIISIISLIVTILTIGILTIVLEEIALKKGYIKLKK